MGRMFRLIDPDPTFAPVYSVGGLPLLERVEISPAYMDRAAEMKVDYDQELLRLIRRCVHFQYYATLRLLTVHQVTT